MELFKEICAKQIHAGFTSKIMVFYNEADKLLFLQNIMRECPPKETTNISIAWVDKDEAKELIKVLQDYIDLCDGKKKED